MDSTNHPEGTAAQPPATRSAAVARSREARQRRRAQVRRRRLVVATVLVLALVGVAVGLTGGSTPAPKKAATSPALLAAPVVRPSIELTTRFPGHAPKLAFPAMGQSAVYVSGAGLLGATANERPEPIASVTKVMTATVVLRDHPMTPTGSGPTFTMTAADHQAWIEASENDDSNLMVVAGEKLTERQLLEALLVPSADNIADYLAVWDAGSIGKFVAKMNAMAARLGLQHTHYVDASGLDPSSRSTAADQAKLAAYAMANPTFAGLVDHAAFSFPLEGAVTNYNPVIGEDGVVGVKSGFTSEASGCLVTAAARVIGGKRVMVISATLGQVLGLWTAGQVDLQLLGEATSLLERRVIVHAGEPVAVVDASWADRTSTASAATTTSVVGWPGLVVRLVVHRLAPTPTEQRHGWAAGCAVVKIAVDTDDGLSHPAVTGVLTSALTARTSS